MRVVFTYPSSRPPAVRPPRWGLLLTLFLILLLPGFALAQTCFELDAGPSRTYCEGDSITLDGGYPIFTGDTANPPTLTWDLTGGAILLPNGQVQQVNFTQAQANPAQLGQFYSDGTAAGGSTSAENFDYSGNPGAGPTISFVPEAGVFRVNFRIRGSAPNCSNDAENVVIYFDPVLETELSVGIDGTSLVVSETGDVNSGDTIRFGTGAEIDLTIDNTLRQRNSEQFDDDLVFRYEVTDGLGLLGLPATTGVLDAVQFDALFTAREITNPTCDSIAFGIVVTALYDRSDTGSPAPSGTCEGPETRVFFNVGARPDVEATAGVGDDLDNQFVNVCANDDSVTVIVTGTPLSTIDYTIDFGDGPQAASIDLDATGVNTFNVNVNDAADGEDEIVILLTGGEYQNGAPCPETFSYQLTLSIQPLPDLEAMLTNPEDTVVCNFLNGGPGGSRTIPFTLTTTNGPGDYAFTILEFQNMDMTDTIEETDLVRTFTDNGDGTASWTGNLDLNGTVTDGTVLTYIVQGSSFTMVGADPPCVNDAPDAMFTFRIQAESFVEYEITTGGVTDTLNDNGPTSDELAIQVCDGSTVTIDQAAPAGDNARIPGTSGAIEVELTDDDDLLGLGGTGTYTYDFDANPFEGSFVLDIPNSQTTSSTISAVITPYFEDNGNTDFDDDDMDDQTDECSGNPLTLTIEVQPAPMVTLALDDADDDVVCPGDEVTLNVTSSTDGTAFLTSGAGGAPTPITVTSGTGSTTVTVDETTTFTLSSFTASGGAGCTAQVGDQVTVTVEEVPTATIAISDELICNGDTATVTLTGSGGNGTGFDFTVDGMTFSTAMGESTVEIELTPGPGSSQIILESVANQGGDQCVNTEVRDTVDLDVEEIPVVDDIADVTVCNGEAVSLAITTTSPVETAFSDSLAFQIDMLDDNDAVIGSSRQFGGAAPAPSIDFVAVNPVINGPPVTMTFAVTPLFVDEDDDVICAGEPDTVTVTINASPNATFGGTNAICAGDDATLIATGPMNGTATIEHINPVTGQPTGNYSATVNFDGGGVDTLTVPDTALDPGDNTFRLSGVTTSGNPAPACTGGGTFDFVVSVVPDPVVAFAPTAVTVCQGEPVTISLTGTPGAAVAIDAGADSPIDTAMLDANGDGSIVIDSAATDLTLTVFSVTVTGDDGNGGTFECVTDGPDVAGIAPFNLTVTPAPTGVLATSEAVLCNGDSPSILFELTQGDAGSTFTIVVNGETLTGVSNNDVISLAPPTELTQTTDFILESIQDEANDMCTDVVDGNLDTLTILVNDEPTVTFDPVLPDTICSGTALNLAALVAPDTSVTGDSLFLQVVLTDGVGPAGTAQTFLVPATEAGSLNAALGLPGTFDNPSQTTNDVIAFAVTPYFESTPQTPQGPGGGSSSSFAPKGGSSLAATGGGGPAPAMTIFDAGTVTTSSNGNGSTATDNGNNIVLEAQQDSGASATATITFNQAGTFPLDVDFRLERCSLFDRLRITLNSTELFDSENRSENCDAHDRGQFSLAALTVMPGDVLTFELLEDGYNTGVNNDDDVNGGLPARVVIGPEAFAPAGQPCPGETVDVEIVVRPELFVSFDDAPGITVCEDDTPTVCLTGTPNTNVSLFVGNGNFPTVKLDENGQGCITLQPQTESNTIEIDGITTLGQDPECSRLFAPPLPLDITVIPTPTATVDIEEDEVCADGLATATFTGTPLATVRYVDRNGDTLSIVLGSDSTATLPVDTENDGDTVGVSTITLVDITTASGTTGVPQCSADLDDSESVDIRPRPNGTLTQNGPVCFGDSVALTFTATTPLEDDYELVIEMPSGMTRTDTVSSGEVVFFATQSGDYILRSLSDGIDTSDMTALSCTATDVDTATVVIEDEVILTAAVSGTVGSTPNLSNVTNRNIFRGITCDMGTINATFGTGTSADTNSTGDPLMVRIDVVENSNLAVGPGMLVVPPAGTSLEVPFSALTFSGILSGLDTTMEANIEVTLTPFFEDDNDVETCAGPPLTFDIRVLPPVLTGIDEGASSSDVCAGDEVTIALTGTPGAVMTFSTFNLTEIVRSDDGDAGNDGDDNTVVIGPDGTATVTAVAGPADSASLTVMMTLVNTMDGPLETTCMNLTETTLPIVINENPTAMLLVEPAGPICNGDTVDVIAMLTSLDGDGNPSADGSYTIVLRDEPAPITVDVVGGKATLIDDRALTETDTFRLMSITNDSTGCVTASDDGSALDSVIIEVEEVPAGTISAIIDGDTTLLTAGTDLSICTGDAIDFFGTQTSGPVLGAASSQVNVSILSDVDFFSFDDGGDTGLTLAEIASELSQTFVITGGTPVTVTVTATFFNESNATDDAEGLSDGECAGTPVTFTITVGPRPLTDDLTEEICSGDTLDIDLDDAITNGVSGVTFTYTVASSNETEVPASDDRTTASADPITDSYVNTTDDPVTITYTVTPTAGDCTGGDFDVTVTVNPEPVIAVDQTQDVCSGAASGLTILLDNDPVGVDSFRIVSIDFPDTTTFVAGDDNVAADSVSSDASVLGNDVFVNTGPDTVTVTYTIVGITEDGCEGASETISLNVAPQPDVVDDLDIEVCSNSRLTLDVGAMLTNNGVGDVITVQRRSLFFDDLRVFDGNDGDSEVFFCPNGQATSRQFNNPLECFGAGGFDTYADGVIRDSFINQATSDLAVVYDIILNNGSCAPTLITLNVTVVEEADVTLDLVDGQSSICSDGEFLTLVANFDDGVGIPTYTYSVLAAEPGVDVILTPSASGGEVAVNAAPGSGMGTATIEVAATTPNGCVARGNRTISVGATPGELAVDGPMDPCADGTSFSFYDIVDPNPNSTYEWSLSNPDAGTFAGGITDGPSVAITFDDSEGLGPFTLSVVEVGPNGCSATTDFEVTLFNGVVADFAVAATGDPLTFEFTELAGGGITNYLWDFGDGDTSTMANPTHTFATADPMATDTFDVTLTVAGTCAPFSASITKQVIVNDGSEMDTIMLVRGVNFISFDVQPSDSSLNAVFSGVNGLVSVSTFEGGASRSFIAGGFSVFNTLHDVERGYGYVVVVDQAQMMTVSGQPVDDTFLIDMVDGVNYCAFLPDASAAATAYFAPMAPELVVASTFGQNVLPRNQTFNPNGFALFNTLQDLHNGIGYAITMRYPGNVEGPVDAAAQPTEKFDIVYGHASGVSNSAGVPIEILNPAGEVVGTIQVNADGDFAATPLYARIEREGGQTVGGLVAGDRVRFRYGDQVIEGPTFTGNFEDQLLELEFVPITNGSELTLSVAPNPADAETTIELNVPADASVEVLVLDVTGRVVGRPIPARALPAGTVRQNWTGVAQLPAGVYHVIVRQDGQLIPAATQRLIKR